MKEQFCPIDGFWPNGPECPIVFCDVEGTEEGGSSDHKVHQESKSNKMEADKIVRLLSMYRYCILLHIQVEIIPALKEAVSQSIKMKQKDKGLKIAVLTPYKAQKYLVQDLLKKKRDLERDLDQKTLTVGTINESQGDSAHLYFVALTVLQEVNLILSSFLLYDQCLTGVLRTKQLSSQTGHGLLSIWASSRTVIKSA